MHVVSLLSSHRLVSFIRIAFCSGLLVSFMPYTNHHGAFEVCVMLRRMDDRLIVVDRANCSSDLNHRITSADERERDAIDVSVCFNTPPLPFLPHLRLHLLCGAVLGETRPGLWDRQPLLLPTLPVSSRIPLSVGRERKDRELSSKGRLTSILHHGKSWGAKCCIVL